jgi:hypothetical protein
LFVDNGGGGGGIIEALTTLLSPLVLTSCSGKRTDLLIQRLK